MKKNKKIFFIWLALVVIWNFGLPDATPAYDVAASVVLSLFAKKLEKNV